MLLTFGNTLVNYGINTIEFFVGMTLTPSKKYFGIFNPFYKINGWAFSFVLGLIMLSSTALSWSWDVVFNGFDSISTLLNVLFVFLLCLNYESSNHFIATISRNTLRNYFIRMILIKLTRPA